MNEASTDSSTAERWIHKLKYLKEMIVGIDLFIVVIAASAVTFFANHLGKEWTSIFQTRSLLLLLLELSTPLHLYSAPTFVMPDGGKGGCCGALSLFDRSALLSRHISGSKNLSLFRD